ncbi:MAG: tetratricopeptide repeat protein [Magnetococcales bacterium]|nr:tetratricopeptide repeat protein [Magnetococcales bacterium]
MTALSGEVEKPPPSEVHEPRGGNEVVDGRGTSSGKEVKSGVEGAKGVDVSPKEGLGSVPVAVSVDDGKSRAASTVAQGEARGAAPIVKDLTVDLGRVGETASSGKGHAAETAEETAKTKDVTTSAESGHEVSDGQGPASGTVEKKGDANVSLLYDRAVELERNGKSDEAIEFYKRVLERESGHLLARQRLARIYVESGKVSEALTVLKPAVAGRDSRSLAGSDPNFSAFLAALYQRQEEHRKAVDLYEALLSTQPSKGIWQMGMAISLEKLNEPGKALGFYEKALESGELSDRLRSFVQKRVRTLKP